MMKKSDFVESDNITLLAKGVLLRGEMRVEGTVRIDGRLEGDLHTAGTVVIGEDGVVQGTIHAGTIISSGKIKATVTATERLQLLKTGILVGEVHAPAFSMEDGAKFQGLSDMGVASWGDDAQKLPGNVRDISAQRPRRSWRSAKTPDRIDGPSRTPSSRVSSSFLPTSFAVSTCSARPLPCALPPLTIARNSPDNGFRPVQGNACRCRSAAWLIQRYCDRHSTHHVVAPEVSFGTEGVIVMTFDTGV